MESQVSAELVRETAMEMEAIIRHLKGNCSDWLPGYRVKILDGNALGASQHRLKPLRLCIRDNLRKSSKCQEKLKSESGRMRKKKLALS